MAGRPWLSIRALWQPVRFDNATSGRAALVTHRRERLPWHADQKSLLVAINDSDRLLLLYDSDQIPRTPLSINRAMLSLSSASYCLTQISEFFNWPPAEAICAEYTQSDLLEDLPSRLLADNIWNRWRNKPIAGWQPAHRGNLGVSFLRDVLDVRNNSICCVEVSASAVLLYAGPLLDNQALIEFRVIGRWDALELDVENMRDILALDDIILIRQLMRCYRFWAYEYALEIEKPF